jgi:hypothetical protein
LWLKKLACLHTSKGLLHVSSDGNLPWGLNSHSNNKVWDIPDGVPDVVMSPWQRLLLSGIYMASVMVEVGSVKPKAYVKIKDIQHLAILSVTLGIE